MSKVLPLLSMAFEPGHAGEMVETIEDEDYRNIARAELYYFRGDGEACSRTVEKYLSDKRADLRLSAELLYVYSNMALGKAGLSQKTLNDILIEAETERKSPCRRTQAMAVFAAYLAKVLLHLPADDLPPYMDYIGELPHGLRLFASYIVAHAIYLDGDYGRALGLCQGAMIFSRDEYPISFIYIYMVQAMCYINMKQTTKAKESFMKSWNIAAKDEFLQPFVEHHGLLQGLLESCIKKKNPKVYKKIIDRVFIFSRGWMAVHNKESKDHVTDALSAMEFSIAMLACRDWTNQEIADYLGMSINTVKHHISTIFVKLDVKKREELKKAVLR